MKKKMIVIGCLLAVFILAVTPNISSMNNKAVEKEKRCPLCGVDSPLELTSRMKTTKLLVLDGPSDAYCFVLYYVLMVQFWWLYTLNPDMTDDEIPQWWLDKFNWIKENCNILP